MENTYQAFCTQQNKAFQVCSSKNCKNSPFICEKQGCECQSFHSTCWLKPLFKDILKQIIKKNDSGQECFKDLIQFCDYGIQLFQLQKNTLEKAQKQKELLLHQNQRKFLLSIKLNKPDELSGNLMSIILQELMMKPEINVALIRQKIAQETKIYGDSLNYIMQGMIKIMSESQNIQAPVSRYQGQNISIAALIQEKKKKVKFSKQMKSSSIKFVSETIVKASSSMQGFYNYPQFIFLEPEIEQIQTDQITVAFRVIQYSQTLLFGVMAKQPLSKNNYHLENSIFYGHCISCSGLSYSQISQQNKIEKYQQFRGINNNDIIHVTYNKILEEVKIQIMGRNEFVTMKAPKKVQYSLYFAIGLSSYSKNRQIAIFPQVEFLGVIEPNK